MIEPVPQGRDLLAAELALGLLEGSELEEARRLAVEDADFARAVSEWQHRLAPLLDDLPNEVPREEVWVRIAGTMNGGDNVLQLRRRLILWRGFGAGMTALAASLALVLVSREAVDAPAVTSPQAAPMLVAAVAASDRRVSLSLAVDTDRRSFVVTPTGLQGAAGHDHELWIVPAGGAPVSLGLIRADVPRRHRLDVAVRPHFRSDASIALSVEPVGGSPTGRPTGPVVASGRLTQI